jgi:hypothetical protein
MAEIKDLSTTDASNTTRFAENQAPSSVNDGARALEGMIARHDKDTVEGNVDSTGSANAYVVAANRTITAYYDGMRQCFHANFANTGAATLNIDSVGAKTIKKNHDQDLASGDIEQHQFVEVVYSASDDTFQMLSPSANAVAAASESTAGVVELATQAEVNTGTDTARTITPAGLSGWTPAVATVTIVSTDKLLLADASASGVLKQGLVSDIAAAIPASKIVTGTPLVLNPWTDNSSTTQAHGLAGQPKLIRAELECITGEYGYSTGDKIDLSASYHTSTARGFNVYSDATNVGLVTSTGPGIIDKSSVGTLRTITSANWKVNLTPYYWA